MSTLQTSILKHPDSSNNNIQFDSNGRVGIGTPNPVEKLHLHSNNIGVEFALTNFNSGSSSSDGCRLQYVTSNLSINNKESGHIEFRTADQSRVQIDASGKLLVGVSNTPPISNGESLFVGGTSSNTGIQVVRYNSGFGTYGLNIGRSRASVPGNLGAVSEGDDLGRITWYGDDGTDLNSQAANIQVVVDGSTAENDMPGRLMISTTADGSNSPTERLRVTTQGATKMSTTNSYYNASKKSIHELRVSNIDDWTCYLTNISSTQPFGLSIRYPNSSPNSNTDDGIRFEDNTAIRFRVLSNGGIANFQSNNSNLCDEREKKNIEPLESTWESLKNWELKKFHYHEDADTDYKRYGVIAQQVAPLCPGVISEWIKQKAEDAVLDEEGNVVTPAAEEITRLAVKEQPMMWMAVKALQEAQERIETLEAKVAALEAG